MHGKVKQGAGFLGAVALVLFLTAGPAMGGEGISPEAEKILRSMSTYLGGVSAFSVKADLDNEIIDLSGQKLQFSSSTTIVVERPQRLYVNRQDASAGVEIIFDGSTLTLHSKDHNAYAQMENPGTIDDAIDTVLDKIGMAAPGPELLYADSYSGLSAGVTKGVYLGTAYVNGIECHHLAFRESRTDWQLWVQVGDAPLPMKYVITTKWVTGAPQYSIRYREWDMSPRIEADLFKFSAPAGVGKMETVAVDVLGELIVEGVQK